jgi:hypothetical protein
VKRLLAADRARVCEPSQQPAGRDGADAEQGLYVLAQEQPVLGGELEHDPLALGQSVRTIARRSLPL